MKPRGSFCPGLGTAVAAALVGLGSGACSSQDDLGRHRGDKGGALDASAGGLASDAKSPIETSGAGGSAGRGSARAAGGATGGRPGADAATGGFVADSGAGGATPAEAGADPIDAAARIPIGQFQMSLVHALCDNAQTCCSAAGLGYDAIHCRQTVIQQYVVPLTDTTLLFDSVLAEACLRAVSQAAHACESVDVGQCFDAFVGNLPPGAPCANGFQCAPGFGRYAICDQTGVCVQPPRGMFGDTCRFTCVESGPSVSCRAVLYDATSKGAACHSTDGLVCVPAANGSATCQPAAADCKQNPDGSCPTGQQCHVISSSCVVPVPLGGSCSTAPCSNDAYCSTSKVCALRKPNAAACMNDSECQSGKCRDSSCAVYSKAAADWCGEPLTP